MCLYMYLCLPGHLHVPTSEGERMTAGKSSAVIERLSPGIRDRVLVLNVPWTSCVAGGSPLGLCSLFCNVSILSHGLCKSSCEEHAMDTAFGLHV